MAYHHKFSISDIENMIPFERDLFVEMTANHIREQEEKMKKEHSRF